MSLDAIVAVYADWGIGANGTQPVVLHADRQHFRELTEGAAVLVGRRTLEDFPGGKPLKGRYNIVVTRQDLQIEGAQVVHDTREALAAAQAHDRCLVIGGASVYEQFFPYTSRIYITKIDLIPHSDRYFPDLDTAKDWVCTQAGAWQEENGLRYQFCTYERVPNAENEKDC